VDTIYRNIKDMPDLPDTEYGELSKQFVFAHHVEAAIWAGKRVADTKQSFSPLAIAYLYAGQYDKAYNLYAEYKSTDRRGFLFDLDEVAATVKHPKPEEVDRIRTFLQTLTFDSIEAQTTDYADEAWRCIQDSNMAGVRAIYAGIKDIPTLRVTNYGFLSGFLALAHEYEGAIWAGERSLRDWKGDVGFLSHLAMCYLYNGQYEQACALYATFKNNQDADGRTGKEAFLQALDAAAAQNAPPKNPGDIARIRAFLAE
jgi:hypothetical protein